MTDPVQFVLAALALLIVPGPTNTVLAVAGAAGGRSPVPLLVAELIGYLAVILLARLVLLPLLAVFPTADLIIRAVVIAYLLFAAYRLWSAPLDLTGMTAVGFGTVLATTFFNPKGLIFAASVFPRNDLALPLYAALFGAIAMGTGLAWFLVGRGVARLGRARTALLPRLGAGALLVFAALLALSAAR